MPTHIRLVAIASVLLLLAGCAPTVTQSIEGSRHELFDSVDALVAASTQVTLVTAESNIEIEGDETTFAETSTTVSVTQVLDPTGLAAKNTLPHYDLTPGDEIAIWQLGNSHVPGPAPLLEIGETYLLFLSPTAIEARGTSSYYITGSTAGLWATDDGDSFHRLADDGDRLPKTLEVGDLTD